MPPSDDDPLRRRQKKVQAAAGGPSGASQAVEPSQPAAKPVDYSRFKGIGDEGSEEAIQSGKAKWDDLNKDQKKQVWEAEEQMDAILEKKRTEEDDWKRQLKEKPKDLSWVQGKHFASYETFCVGRVDATLKKEGNEAFKLGEYDQALGAWQAGVDMLLSLGTLPPEAMDMLAALRNNMAQLHIKRGEWSKVKELTDKILDTAPTNEKALYRRAQAFVGLSLWEKAEKDLEQLAKHHPGNKDAASMLVRAQKKLGRDKAKLAGRAVSDIAAGMLELAKDGTVRKLKIDEHGEGDPDEGVKWLQPEWLTKGNEKVVVTCQLVISSVGGEELYNSREYRPFPETKQARDELKEYMDMVNFLDQEAGKKPRLVGDFYRKVKKRPVRWYVGDPGMYNGFDLAVRSMRIGERAVFEVDQPRMAASVEKYYEALGFHSTLAGLPQLTYHIEEERMAILEDEIPAEELDLDTKTQRGVRVDIQLMGRLILRDTSPDGDGARLHGVHTAGQPEDAALKRGETVRGAFFITRPFDGSLLVKNSFCEWRLGVDEGVYEKMGENKEPLRPDGGAFVPKCIGDALLQVDWEQLREGCLVEVRTRVGPELHEIAPQYAQQFEQARRENHRRGKKGGAPCSILVQIFPAGWQAPEDEQDQQTIVDSSVPADMEIE